MTLTDQQRRASQTSLLGWLIWTTGIALAVACHRPLLSADFLIGSPRLGSRTVFFLFSFTTVLFIGTAWGALMDIATRPLRHLRDPVEPGYWLLASLGLVFLGSLAQQWIVGISGADHGIFIAGALVTLPWLMPLFDRRLPWNWRAYCTLLLVTHAAFGLFELAHVANVSSPLVERGLWELAHRVPVIGLAGLLVAIAFDPLVIRADASKWRTWRHWLGVVLLALCFGFWANASG